MTWIAVISVIAASFVAVYSLRRACKLEQLERHPEYRELVVSGIQSGDGDSWLLCVSQDDFRRLVKPAIYEAEMEYRRENEGTQFALDPNCFHLSPSYLFSALGIGYDCEYPYDHPMTIRLQVRPNKSETPHVHPGE